MTIEQYKRLLNHLYAAKEYYFEYCYGESFQLNMDDVDEMIVLLKSIIDNMESDII